MKIFSILILVLTLAFNCTVTASEPSKCNGSPDKIADSLRLMFDELVEYYQHLESPNAEYRDYPRLPDAIKDGAILYIKDRGNTFGFGHVKVLSIECVIEFLPNSSYSSLACGIAAKDGPFMCRQSGLIHVDQN
ncbi:hypothetical protein [Simiduia aestuariiviva]|uniref:Uncharacterized protein n=1 Tax=Simiduia aestuariiviva TaxID=1510459 RepID=A0A839UN57_9GAMM|nr:hypothetical protein [Simiduia aestuariiviva]MBB3167176.1 hypothetical protein [Simiduia aestuariiviva]